MVNNLVYLKPGCPPVYIYSGFSWTAFLFGFVWAYYHRLWGYGTILLGSSLLLGCGLAQILVSVGRPTLGNILWTVGTVILSIWVGSYGNRWRITRLHKQGYALAEESKSANL